MAAAPLTPDGRLITGALLAFVAIAALAAIDLATDLRGGTTVGHVLVEASVALVGLAGAAYMLRRLIEVIRRERASRAEAAELAARLDSTAARLAESQAEAARWRTEAGDLLRGLGAALDQQFEHWGLSPAEKEVALLLLKGLSHKEVAEVRSITEATARQQARAVYKKAGLSGRNDLAAFFLEDLLLPAARPTDQAG